ncbi:GNAT family N-acetyltransferase [Euhalothece natronophila Z-M001]|uniref:GNAT family N-acetyltransferase n=1 Tax=Euhalothece natronophila Z-M001 TaxID=522448 RepID=A0A5B8NK47_9CHRO|nr:N-acetyltransferase [Euhalothece natronophila]QDZ39318.1 GNAT family N-acetyltransferase [Euhalothece natronophila Z-M001]
MEIQGITPSGEKVDYLPMSLQRHNPEQVANLIYASSPELFSLMFGSQATQNLTQLVQGSENKFSYQYVRVAQISKQVVGIAIIIPAKKLSINTDFKRLNYPQQLRLGLLERLLFPFVLQQDYPEGSFYLANLAVTSRYRNQGIGRQLLSNCIDEASNYSGSLYISVDVENVRAKKLYESMGFQFVQEKVINLGRWRVGSLVLALSA